MAETIWRSRSRRAGTFLSIASSHWELIISRYGERIYCSMRGPETHPTMAQCPPEGEWLGIHFRHGVFMPHMPVGDLVDNSVDLPGASGRSFWLHGSAWEFPTYDNAETFNAGPTLGAGQSDAASVFARDHARWLRDTQWACRFCSRPVHLPAL